jgi:GH25 family lysozyme M1 (1,4-beta-N-acetylmuramidase)
MTLSELPAMVFDAVIDVSHHNGAIDWPAVAGIGIALVFIKATQGVGFVDPTFDHNRSAAIRAGVLVAPYHFIDTADPSRQAAHFLTVTGLRAGDVAMIDWETETSAEAVAAFGMAVADRCGRDPVAYYGFAQLDAPHPVLSRWPLMLPEYPCGENSGRYETLVSRPPRLPPGRADNWQAGARPCDFHQYTPSGRVAGIATFVDRSVWVGTASELKAWFATGALSGVAVPTVTG